MTPIPPSPPRIRLVQIARMAQGGRWRVEAMRSYSSHLLLWFTRGQGRITVSGNTRGYGAHNAIFLPAGTMHGFETSASVFGTALFVPRNLGLKLPKMPLHLRVRDQAPQMELTGLLENLQRELEAARLDSGTAAFHHVGLFAVWLERMKALGYGDQPRESRATRISAEFSTMVEEQYSSGKSVKDYADALGITPTHLSRVCNQTCGRSASELLRERLLFEAQRMLKDTMLPINQVSARLGFNSPAYFSRAFHGHTGTTPSAFRRQN